MHYFLQLTPIPWWIELKMCYSYPSRVEIFKPVFCPSSNIFTIMKSIRELQWKLSDDVCISDAQGMICVTESAMIISVVDVFLSSCLLQSSPTPSMKSPTKMPQYFQPNMLPPPPPPPVARPVAIIRTTDGQATVVSTPGGLMSSGRPDSFSAYVSLYVSTVTMPYWHVSHPCYVATAGSVQALSLWM